MTEQQADRTLTVVAAGFQLTVQDLGRPGHAHLGVPRSGALDGPALQGGYATDAGPNAAGSPSRELQRT